MGMMYTCLCIHVCMFMFSVLCIHMCMYPCAQLCELVILNLEIMYEWIYIYIHFCICVCLYTWVFSCVCVCQCFCVNMHVCLLVCMYIHGSTSTCACTQVSVNMYVHTCIPICTCVCVRVHISHMNRKFSYFWLKLTHLHWIICGWHILMPLMNTDRKRLLDNKSYCSKVEPVWSYVKAILEGKRSGVSHYGVWGSGHPQTELALYTLSAHTELTHTPEITPQFPFHKGAIVCGWWCSGLLMLLPTQR